VLGWLLLLAARFFLGRPAARLDLWLWQLTTGRRERLEVGDLPPLLVDIPAETPREAQP